MDLEAVIWFAVVARQGSFANASRYLKQPTSNVSRRIARLEEQLGNKLFHRTTRSLALTDEGDQLLPLANQLIESSQSLEDWRDSHQKIPSGMLRVTAPSSFARVPLSQWLTGFRRSYPQVVTELIHSNQYLDFQEHQLDVAFRQGPLPSSSLVAKRLFGIEYGVFASPAWLDQQTEIAEPEDLNQVEVISTGVRRATLPWRFKNQTLQPKLVAMQFEEPNQCLQAAAQGIACTYASYFEASPWLQAGELVEILIAHRSEPASFYMVTQNREHRSIKLARFMAYIEKEILTFGKAEGLVF